jgi:hypothetical protein
LGPWAGPAYSSKVGRGRRPVAIVAVCPCGCEGRIADHDDRGWGAWPCPVCLDDSDADLGEPCTECATFAPG